MNIISLKQYHIYTSHYKNQKAIIKNNNSDHSNPESEKKHAQNLNGTVESKI